MYHSLAVSTSTSATTTIDPALTCDGRCGSAYQPIDPCQCNDACPAYFNCCDDYDDLCVPKGSLSRVGIVVTVLVGVVVVVVGGIPVSSVANFLVLGGQDPEMYRQKYIDVYRASERSERAPQKNLFS